MTNSIAAPASPGRKLLRRFLRRKLAVFGAGILTLVFLGALFAPWLAPQNPYDLLSLSMDNSLLPPIWAEGGQAPFYLGTDVQGRDILSTILYGSRTSLIVGVSVVFLTSIIGGFVGLIAGFYGGWLDTIIMRMGDSILSFSTTLIAMLFLGLFQGSSMLLVICAISIGGWVQYARTMRSSVLVVKEEDYVTGARAIGASNFRIAIKHIVPNAFAPLFVIAAIDFGVVIMLEATLSFLGIGVPITEPSLGMMIAQGKDFIYAGLWYLILCPGIVLMSIIFSLNLLADWLSEEIDPRASK
ncbi:ABC transporter permease [Marinomonas sp. 5E14-1]|uniref:ABC transporter permease n=1 Tax=Marinomonas sp. 5E14-1 TaxID=3153922 RepID=UPI0032669B0B